MVQKWSIATLTVLLETRSFFIFMSSCSSVAAAAAPTHFYWPLSIVDTNQITLSLSPHQRGATTPSR